MTTGEYASTLTMTITHDGQSVNLQPYPGSYGHLVILREGDLAYLHAHPQGAEPTAGSISGPQISSWRNHPHQDGICSTSTSRSTATCTPPGSSPMRRQHISKGMQSCPR